MPAPKPSFRPRPGGGFNQGIGHFNEHLDEDAMQQSVKQKALTQQTNDPATAQAAAQGQSAHAQQPGQGQFPGQQPGGAPPRPPREVSSIADELITRPAHDIIQELTSFFSLNTWLGIKPPNPDDPQEVARKKQMHQRWQKLNDEQQEVAKRRYQEEMQKKKTLEEEEQRKKQMEEQQKAQTLEMPSSPQKGPVGPAGSKKQKAVQKLQQDRKTLGGPSSQF